MVLYPEMIVRSRAILTSKFDFDILDLPLAMNSRSKFGWLAWFEKYGFMDIKVQHLFFVFIPEKTVRWESTTTIAEQDVSYYFRNHLIAF
jgi:hypothetical protein